jgi:DNA-binding response OmpR family regulator
MLHVLFWYGCIHISELFGEGRIVTLAFTAHFGTKSQSGRLFTSSSDEAEPELPWILLAGGEQTIRNRIGKYLANEGGFRVTGVADAKSVLLICRGTVVPKQISHFTNATNTKYPDCVVVDAHLSGSLDGMQLLKLIRSAQSLKYIPILLLLDRGRVGTDELDADAYLSKPFDLEELLSLVDGLLKRSKGSTLTTSESDNITMEVNELRRELAEIKRLLMTSGFSAHAESKSTGSIQDDLALIKETVLNGRMHMHPNVTKLDEEIQAPAVVPNDDATSAVFSPGV